MSESFRDHDSCMTEKMFSSGLRAITERLAASKEMVCNRSLWEFRYCQREDFRL